MPLLVLSLVATGIAWDDGRKPDAEETQYACGVQALYQLLRFERRPVPIEELARAFPEGGPQGHSLEQIHTVARRFGLDLEGTRLSLEREPLDVPTLVHFEQEGHGHFALVRPVGKSGSLIQLLDGGHQPAVIRREDLLRLPGWTGIGLSRRSTSALTWIAGVVFVGSLAALAAVAIRTRRKGN